MAYRNTDRPMASIAKELKVAYLITGAVRRSGARVRVTINLIDPVNGRELWSSKYDEILDDVFGAQDRITKSVVNAIDPAIRKSEIDASMASAPESLDAWDLTKSGFQDDPYLQCNST